MAGSQQSKERMKNEVLGNALPYLAVELLSNFRQLDYASACLHHFLAVVDDRNFTRAAERMYRTESALSQSIRKLEDEIGAPLFTRVMYTICP